MHESILAGRLLTIMAGRTTESLTTFSSWLIGSFAAILGLLLSKIDTVTTLLPAACIGLSIKIFLIAVSLHVLQRYLGAIVSGSEAASKEAESAAPAGVTLDFSRVVNEIERSIFWPARIFLRWTNKKILAGDFAAPGRLVVKLTQAQAFLVLGQMGFVGWAAYSLANGLV
ncbi:MAG: hypothetical protein M0Z73_02590 [Betaproteobacteria bacterium]|nr:hypothetical protein [Betaproteobacteria bacterium]